jgi:hypothetical protein
VASGALLVFALATVTKADPDLWGHLRFGRDMLETRHLSSGDLYSFTQDQPWLNHEWLSELLMAGAFVAGGTAGLVLLKATLLLGVFLVVWPAFRGVDFGARAAVVAALVLGTGSITKTWRPQLWSLLGLAVLCRVLAEDRRRARRWLPLLFVLWANLHGGWLLGLGVLGLWVLASVWTRRDRTAEWIAIVAMCALGTFCTPYGWSLWAFVRHSVGTQYAITEWQPLWNTASADWLVWVPSAAVGLWSLAAGSDRLRRAAVLAALALASLRLARVTPFFVTSAGLLIAPSLARQWPARTLPIAANERPFALVMFAAALTVFAWVVSASARCIEIAGSWAPDRLAVPLLNSAGPGRLVTSFNWGEYAIWHWGPSLQVSIDGRGEAYSDARFVEYRAVREGTAEGLHTLNTWRAEYVWLPADSRRTRDWLASHGYRIEHDSDQSFLAVRTDLSPLRSVGAVGPAACFPD